MYNPIRFRFPLHPLHDFRPRLSTSLEIGSIWRDLWKFQTFWLFLDRTMLTSTFRRRHFMPEVANCCLSRRSALLHAYLVQIPNLKKIIIFGGQAGPHINHDSRIGQRPTIEAGDYSMQIMREGVKLLVERDPLLRYLGDIEIEEDRPEVFVTLRSGWILRGLNRD